MLVGKDKDDDDKDDDAIVSANSIVCKHVQNVFQNTSSPSPLPILDCALDMPLFFSE